MGVQRSRAQRLTVPCAYCAAHFADWEARERHVHARHRARYIVDRMDDLNRQAAAEVRRTGRDFDQHREEAVEYRALLREWWALPMAEYSPILMEGGAPIPTTDPFRARTIARNACIAVRDALFWNAPRRRCWGYDQAHPEAPDVVPLVIKAARAVRRVRPDLFEGYTGSTIYGGDVDA